MADKENRVEPNVSQNKDMKIFLPVCSIPIKKNNLTFCALLL